MSSGGIEGDAVGGRVFGGRRVFGVGSRSGLNVGSGVGIGGCEIRRRVGPFDWLLEVHFPMALFGGESWVGGVEEGFDGIDLGFPELLLFALGVGEEFEAWGFVTSVGILGLVEDGEEAEVFLL